MKTSSSQIREGCIIVGSLFNEPMRVETVRFGGDGTWTVGLVGTQSERFRKVTLTDSDINTLTILDSAFSYDGDGRLLRLGLQAYSLGIAYEFDPYFGLSISRVDPLPHQLEAVYDYLLKLARVRFLLADDAGAGKTIMAGLLILELQLRGLAEHILVVCPANLSFQWQSELREKFDEKFFVLKGGDIRDQFGVNRWLEQNKIITSLDLAKRTEILPGLRQVHWDLVIVDEAHRMSWTPPARKTARYALEGLASKKLNLEMLVERRARAQERRVVPETIARFIREAPDVRRMRPSLETEDTAMRMVMEYEQAQGRQVYDVHEKNLGYDITSLDLNSGDLRLIEVKGLAVATGTILLTPNEQRVAEDRRDCYWLYIVTNCGTKPTLQESVKDPARLEWHEVTKVAHYWLEVNAMTRPTCPPKPRRRRVQVREDEAHYGDDKP